MEARPDQRTMDHEATQLYGYNLGQYPQNFRHSEGETSMELMDPLDKQIAPQLRRLSLCDTPLLRSAQDESSTAKHSAHPLATNLENSCMTSMQAKRHVNLEGCDAGNTNVEKQQSLPCGSGYLSGQNTNYYGTDHRGTQNSFSSHVAVDLPEENHEEMDDPQKDAANTSDPMHFQYRLTGRKWRKTNGEQQSDAPHMAQDAFAQVKFWREIFSALTGMHGVYVPANFAFDNTAGGICSLFCFLCSVFAQLDRRAPSYFLTALLSFCLGVVVAVSLTTPVRGFEVFSENMLLRRISITQVCLLFLQTPVSIIVALRIVKLHSFLRKPGVLVPLECSEKADHAAAPKCNDDRNLPNDEGSECAFQIPPVSVACGSAMGAPLDRILSTQ